MINFLKSGIKDAWRDLHCEDKKLAWKQFRNQNCFVAKSKWESHFEISAEVFDALVQWSRDCKHDIRTIDFVWEMETGLRMPDETTQQRMKCYWQNGYSIGPSSDPLREYFPFDYSSVLDIPKALLKELLVLAKMQGSPAAAATLWKFCLDRNIPETLQEELRKLEEVPGSPTAIDSLWKFCVGLSPPSSTVATGLLDIFPSLLTTAKSPPKQFGSHLQEQLSFIKDSKIEETSKINMGQCLRTASLDALIDPSTYSDDPHFQAYHLIRSKIKGGPHHDCRHLYMECLLHLSRLPKCRDDNKAFAKALNSLKFEVKSAKKAPWMDAVEKDVVIFENILNLRTQYTTGIEEDEELVKMVDILSWRLGNESKFLLENMDYGFCDTQYVIEPVLTAFLHINHLKMKVTSVAGKPVVANFKLSTSYFVSF